MRVFIPLVLLLLCGCRSGIRTRAAHDLRCAEDEISITSTGAGGYRAVGCSRARSYVCGGRTCVAETDVETLEISETQGTSVRPGMDPAEVRAALVRATYEPMRACLRDATMTLTLDVELAAGGVIRPIEIHQRVGAEEAGCISRIAREASNPGWGEDGRLTLTYAPDGPPIEPAAPSQPVVAAQAPSEPPTLRARVDAHRSAILSCAPGGTVALVVEWTAEGALVPRLRDHTGSPEEGCIASVLASERLEPAPGTAGSLLHVVEAP